MANQADSKKTLDKKFIKKPIAIAVIAIILLMILAFGFSYFSDKNKETHDTEVSNRYDNFVSTETDCNKFMQEFENESAYDPETEAELLAGQISCSQNLGEYDKSLEYLGKIKEIYDENPSLYQYVNVEETTRQINEQKQRASDSNPENTEEPTPIGRQKDGSYNGP